MEILANLPFYQVDLNSKHLGQLQGVDMISESAADTLILILAIGAWNIICLVIALLSNNERE